MKLFNYLDRYMADDLFRVIITNYYVDIVNYDEIIDFSSKEVSVKYDRGVVVVKGDDLVVSKMMDDEVIIKGNVKSVNI